MQYGTCHKMRIDSLFVWYITPYLWQFDLQSDLPHHLHHVIWTLQYTTVLLQNHTSRSPEHVLYIFLLINVTVCLQTCFIVTMVTSIWSELILTHHLWLLCQSKCGTTHLIRREITLSLSRLTCGQRSPLIQLPLLYPALTISWCHF